MCDILVATSEATENGEMIFAKNSDRDPNEAQVLEFVPRRASNETVVKMTYTKFPQAEESYAILLSRPWWMWGAEMGANEYGLVVGNTAVFTKEPYDKVGILGMDLIRLALERTKTSRDALNFMISVIEKQGQGGSGSCEHELLYHNSFVMADPKEAYALETAGRYWVARRIRGVYSTSNALVKEGNWDLSSQRVVEHAVEKGWCKDRLDFNFARCYSDRFYTRLAKGRERRAFTYKKLKEKEGEVNLSYIMELLRSHQKEPYAPERGSMRDICMHYGGLTRPSQTAASQISVLAEENKLHWFTGTSIPCLSIFKPFHIGASLPKTEERPTNRYDPRFYWWRFEKFHRKLQTNYEAYTKDFTKDRDSLQSKILKETAESLRSGLGGLEKITSWAFERESELLMRWESQVRVGTFPLTYGFNWRRVNNKAGMNISK